MGTSCLIPHERLHYKGNGTTWTQLNSLSYEFWNDSCLIVHENKLYAGGFGDSESYAKEFYMYDDINDRFDLYKTLQHGFKSGASLVYNNKIHLLGGYYSRQKYYILDADIYVRI